MTVAMPGRREGKEGKESKESKESAACSFPLTTAAAAALPVHDVLDRLESGLEGLPETEARRRLVTAGPNAVRSHRARAWPVLARQLRSPLLALLTVTAVASAFVGQASDAMIIGTILLASVGLGFGNEYKAEKTAEALHSSVRHRCVVLRDGHPRDTDVVTAGAVLPATPFGRMLGFRPLPGPFFLALVLMVVAYLLLIELGKYWFYRSYRAPAAAAPRPAVPARRRRVHRRAARFTTG